MFLLANCSLRIMCAGFDPYTTTHYPKKSSFMQFSCTWFDWRLGFPVSLASCGLDVYDVMNDFVIHNPCLKEPQYAS